MRIESDIVHDFICQMQSRGMKHKDKADLMTDKSEKNSGYVILMAGYSTLMDESNRLWEILKEWEQ